MKNTLCIFDCFGVLMDELAPVWLAGRYGEEQAVILKQQYFSGADQGLVDVDGLIENLSKGLSIPVQTIRREWAELIVLNRELLSYLEKLRGKACIALLSNAPKGLVEGIFEKYDLFRYFDRVFISGVSKIAKPSVRFYELCVQSFAQPFDRIVMIDDNPANFAELAGTDIQPVHFTTNEALFLLLEEMGL